MKQHFSKVRTTSKQYDITTLTHSHTHTHPFNGPFSGTTQVSRYQKKKPICILLKQETVSGSGISWAIWKSAPCSRQTTTPAPHHSVFTGRIPILQPNQQRQRTEDYYTYICNNPNQVKTLLLQHWSSWMGLKIPDRVIPQWFDFWEPSSTEVTGEKQQH